MSKSPILVLLLGCLLMLAAPGARAQGRPSIATPTAFEFAAGDAREVEALIGTENRVLASLGAERDGSLGPQSAGAAVPRPEAQAVRQVEYDRDWLDRQPRAQGGAQLECLAQALYFEARGESVKGQFAVAEVILNRVASPGFPDTVCGVVNQGSGKRFGCQFTYACDGRAETIAEPKAYARVAKIARAMLDGAPRALTDGATYYHTLNVHPSWSRKFLRTATIGAHHFYRGSRT